MISSDAAHTIHPLAGLGVNLGFGDVITLTDTLKTAIAMGADIGKSQDPDAALIVTYMQRQCQENFMGVLIFCTLLDYNSPKIIYGASTKYFEINFK